MKRVGWTALAITVIASSVAVAMLRARTPPLPNYGMLPEFTLVGADGQPFGSRQLAGHPWVADFIFTSCPEVCPRMTTELAHLQTYLTNRGLDSRVHLVSISVDPDRDTPAVLRSYAEQVHARPQTWSFLTGSKQAIEDAVVHGFKIAVSREKDTSEDNFAIIHGTKFVLIDAQRQIRGYYDSNDAQSLAALRRDVAALADGAR